jgi:hypothetical protein
MYDFFQIPRIVGADATLTGLDAEASKLAADKVNDLSR